MKYRHKKKLQTPPTPTPTAENGNGFRLQLRALITNKVKRFSDDIGKRYGKTNLTEDWLYNRIKRLLLPGNYIACEACGMKMTWDGITIDHKIPRSFHKHYDGNIHNVENLNVICPSCNSLKGQKTLQEYLETLKKRNEDIVKLSHQHRNDNTPPIIAPMYPDIGLGQKLFGPDRAYKRLKKSPPRN